MNNEIIWNIINSYFENNPQNLVKHHIDSFNDFYKNGIFKIFKETKPIEFSTILLDEKKMLYKHRCLLYFGGKNGNKIYFGKPVIFDNNSNTHYMYPNEARLRNMTYGMTIQYDIDVELIDILEENDNPKIPFEKIEEEMKTSGGSSNEIDYTNEYLQEITKGNYKIKPELMTGGEISSIDGGAPKAKNIYKITTKNIQKKQIAPSTLKKKQ